MSVTLRRHYSAAEVTWLWFRRGGLLDQYLGEDLKPWPCLGQKKFLKYIPCFAHHRQSSYPVPVRTLFALIQFLKFFGMCSRFRLWVIYQLLPIKSKYAVEKLQSYSRVDCEKPVVPNLNRSEYFELGHSDRFYHARAVRDFSTFMTKSCKSCPFYIKVINSSVLLHTSLAVLFSESVKSKVLQRLTQHSDA